MNTSHFTHPQEAVEEGGDREKKVFLEGSSCRSWWRVKISKEAFFALAEFISHQLIMKETGPFKGKKGDWKICKQQWRYHELIDHTEACQTFKRLTRPQNQSKWLNSASHLMTYYLFTVTYQWLTVTYRLQSVSGKQWFTLIVKPQVCLNYHHFPLLVGYLPVLEGPKK